MRELAAFSLAISFSGMVIAGAMLGQWGTLGLSLFLIALLTASLYGHRT